MAKMPPNQAYEFTGPWGGISNLVSAKQIIPSDFASANNVTNIGGRIAPRPGYSALTDAPLSIIQMILTGADDSTGGSGVASVRVNQSNTTVYYSNTTNANIYSRLIASGSATLEFATGGTAGEIRGIDLTHGSYIYWCDITNRTISRADWGTWGNITVLCTLGAGNAPLSIAVDTVNSKIWILSILSSNLTLQYCALGGGAAVGAITVSSGTQAYQIRVDSTGTNMYFGDDNVLYKATCASNGVTQTAIYTSSTATNDIKGIALDEANSRVYFIEAGSSESVGVLKYVPMAGTTAVTYLSPVGGGGPLALDRHTSTGRMVVGDTATNISPGASMYRVTGATDFQIISSYWINRSVLDVDESASEYSKDILLLQMISSSFSDTRFVALFPTSGKKYVMSPGYFYGQGATDALNIWVSKDRDTAISTSYAGSTFSGKSGRASFAWTGAGINTGKGGLLIADGDAQWVFNYVLGDTVQTVAIGSGGGGDTFTLTYDGETTSSLAWNASAATVKAALEALNAINGVVVTLSGTTYTIRFVGALAGQNAETLTGTGTGCTVTIAVTQTGGTDTDATLYLRPVGLPTPTQCNIASVGPASGVITGYYEYYVTYYSSTWDIESPPSTENGLALLTTESVDVSTTAPGTMYFEGTAGSTYAIPNGPLIDFWRLYRRKRGSYAGGTAGGGDGVDADPTWYFIAQTPIGTLTYRDNTPDTGIDFSSPLPTDNAYPPADAQWVEICNGRSVWASARSEDTNIWPSELAKAGGVANGEFGFEYVSDFKFFKPEFLAATDTPITGLKTYNGLLYIGTEKEVVATTLDGVDTVGPSIIRLRGVGGFASQWMIAETTSLPNQPGNLFWVSPNGWVYSFNGAQTQLLSRKIDATSRTFARQFWHATSYFPSSFTSNWYWCSALCDPIRNKFLFTAPVDGGANIVIDYCLDFDAWFKWSIPAYAMVLGREWSGSTGKGEPLVCFADANGYLYKLKDGKADNGTSFEWTYSTAKMDFGMPLRRKLIHEAIMGFDVRSFGASNPTVAVAANLNDNVTVTGTSTTISTATNAQAGVAPKNTKVRHVQLSVTGTHTTDLSHPELVGAYVSFEPDTGEARE